MPASSHSGSRHRNVHDCPDHEDNLILDLAAEEGAVIIVSDEAELTSMSPWRATPIVRPREFSERVDATRRARRR
jgi:predicted nucleic acid-binding protein